jgi:hypothetical protein
MTSKIVTIFLYLARRDKTGIQVMARVSGRDIAPTRVENIDALMLPFEWESELKELVHQQRMNWELWAEAAENYEVLKKALRVRGYSNLPMSEQIKLSSSNITTPVINGNNLKSKSVMVRRGT